MKGRRERRRGRGGGVMDRMKLRTHTRMLCTLP